MLVYLSGFCHYNETLGAVTFIKRKGLSQLTVLKVQFQDFCATVPLVAVDALLAGFLPR